MGSSTLFQKVATPEALPVSLLIDRAQVAIEALSCSYGDYLRELTLASYRLHMKYLREGGETVRQDYLRSVRDIRTSAETASCVWPAQFAKRLEHSLEKTAESNSLVALISVQMDALLISTQDTISTHELMALDEELSKF